VRKTVKTSLRRAYSVLPMRSLVWSLARPTDLPEVSCLPSPPTEGLARRGRPGLAARAYGFSTGLFGYLGINARLTTPPSLSQSSTPFVASWRQDIPHVPLVEERPPDQSTTSSTLIEEPNFEFLLALRPPE
jgi:hypothetical protein